MVRVGSAILSARRDGRFCTSSWNLASSSLHKWHHLLQQINLLTRKPVSKFICWSTYYLTSWPQCIDDITTLVSIVFICGLYQAPFSFKIRKFSKSRKFSLVLEHFLYFDRFLLFTQSLDFVRKKKFINPY